MAEDLAEATVGQFKRHPWIWAGIAVVIIGGLFLLKGSGSQAASSYTFSYGPSDAQVAAGTQLQIAQAADQTATNMQTAQLAAQQSEVGDYLSYLTTNSANNLSATQNNNAVTLQALADQTTLGLNAYTNEYYTQQANQLLEGQALNNEFLAQQGGASASQIIASGTIPTANT